MEKSNKKSFLKGLFIGIGGTFLTALLGITVYGCASINAKGAKAFGFEEINIVTGDWGSTQVATSQVYQVKYSSFSIENNIDQWNGDISYNYLYEGAGDYNTVLSTNDLDSDAPVVVSGEFHRRNNNDYSFTLNAEDAPSAVSFSNPSFVRVYRNGTYNADYNFIQGQSVSYSFNTSSAVAFEVWLTIEPATSALSFVYNQPLFDTSSSSSEDNSVSVETFGKYYSFAKGVFPAEIAPNLEYGNIGIFESERANSYFDVYLSVTTQVNNQNYDRIALHFKSLNRSYDNYTEYVTLSGATVGTVGGGLGGGIDNNRFYCDSVTLDYYVGQGSTVSWYETVLAKCPEVFYNNSKRTVDTRLSWVFYQNEFYFSPYSLNDAVQGVSWGASLTNEQALTLIGASAYASNIGQGTWTDVFDLFGDAFGVVEVIFNMQVFPFATLGVFLLIPIVVGIVLFVVGLFKR